MFNSQFLEMFRKKYEFFNLVFEEFPQKSSPLFPEAFLGVVSLPGLQSKPAKILSKTF